VKKVITKVPAIKNKVIPKSTIVPEPSAPVA
jgi:hypothetical protein